MSANKLAQINYLQSLVVKYGREIEQLQMALRDISYVGGNGHPVEGKDQNAVAKWCARRAHEALALSSQDRGTPQQENTP